MAKPKFKPNERVQETRAYYGQPPRHGTIDKVRIRVRYLVRWDDGNRTERLEKFMVAEEDIANELAGLEDSVG